MAVDSEPLHRFHIPPPPKEDSDPEIITSWKMENGTEMLLIEVLHSNPAVLHPDSKCTGHLRLHFTNGAGRGVIVTPCQGCHQTGVEVSLSAISLSLGLEIVDRSGTRWEGTKP